MFLFHTLKGINHINMIQGLVGHEVDDQREAERDQRCDGVADGLDIDGKMDRGHVEHIGQAAAQGTADRQTQQDADKGENECFLIYIEVNLLVIEAKHLHGGQLPRPLRYIGRGQGKQHDKGQTRRHGRNQVNDGVHQGKGRGKAYISGLDFWHRWTLNTDKGR